MTDVAHRKAPAPILTRIVQLSGLAAVVLGVLTIVDAIGCTELDCLASMLGAMAIAWGVLALLAGLRHLAGFCCLIASIVIALMVVWAVPWFTLPFLAAVLVLVRFSKDRLKAFYRNEPVESA